MPTRGPEDMMAAVAASMHQRTGRTVEEWVDVVNASGIDPLDQKAVRRWLKARHDIPQNSRWAIAHTAARAAGWQPPTEEESVDKQYAGPKAALRPIFDHVRAIIEDFGDDVAMEGRASYIPFIRRRQFAAIAAATRTRVDIGLRYTDPPTSERLTAGNAPGQGTHKLPLTAVDDIDDEVRRLLQAAYDQNG